MTGKLSGVKRVTGCMGLAILAATTMAQTAFSDAERARTLALWAEPNRYATLPLPDAATHGSWRVRQNPTGSTWLLAFYKARNANAKVIPGQPPAATNPRQAAWDAWIDQRYIFEVRVAEQKAWDLNTRELGRPPAGTAPAPGIDPGPPPADMVAQFGVPPAMAICCQPQVHSVNFADLSLTYQDNTPVRAKYPYYRFADGVMSVGQKVRMLPAAELADLLKAAGISESESRVFAAVSLLEGGFDSLNTYDTGFVSVGFIQFASLSQGSGSLGQVLRRMKQSTPNEFDRHFRQFGLDVSVLGQLVALDLATGREVVGPEANLAIIRDKRLAAVFQRAGRLSREFRVAQLQIAKEMYYPADDKLIVKVGDRVHEGKVSDVFRTEAGLATLMDRKVNTGKLGDLVERISQVMALYGLTNLKEASLAECQLVRMLRYREDYLDDLTLSRPRDLSLELSRRGQRGGQRPPPSSGT